MPSDSIDTLTPREREVLTLIAEGDSLAEIAQKLSRSLKTIESHRLSLGRKLKVSNRVELAHIAIGAGLVALKTDEPVTLPASIAGMAQTELDWMQQINEAVFNATGATFIKRFCDAVSLLPGVLIGAVCTPDPTLANGTNYQRYVIGISRRGVASDPIRYHAASTPCETIIKEGECCYSKGVAQAYPDDAWLQELNAESYLGIQLLGDDGSPCGGIGLIGAEPLDNIDAYRNVITFFAPRLASELKLCLELNALRNRCDTLENQTSALAAVEAGGSGPGLESLPPAAIATAQINTDVQALAGPTFLRATANSLCNRLGVKAAGICMFVNQSEKAELASVMYSVDGQVEENFVYNPIDLPCETTLNKGVFSLPKQAREAFPDDQYFIDMGIDAYIGVRLEGLTGEAVGTFWICHTHAISDPETVEQVMRHFAPRIGAEVMQFQQIEELLLEQEQLKRELSSYEHNLKTGA